MYIEMNGTRLPDERNGNSHGHIQLVLGPMFSGKTTELIRRMRRYKIANLRCLLVKYEKDDRYDAQDVTTHDHASMAAIKATALMDVENEAKKHDVIGIDEGQFFPDTVAFAERMASQGRVVIVAALDGTFQRKGFANILELVPLSESVIKLQAVCMMCYNGAAFTKRIGNETELEVIGGADKYMAVCRICYTKDPADKKK
ncbi:thymidine kinase, cytosolic-like [Varroa jacobsoni]|uniref:Thymidine kinase n=1 Tax=Varroa destructor TaxID=109461 RepID=A0A7M7J4Y2_VARDE|nr:thymidine kinase, cytosolic-like [Varroa destructor]XP_022644272.1 thymidine kinase, cytosolic-like [Varroa destructor]XP_022644281.1 thymidine kinase, cytosolic-like [Varroa destructor]XP_022697769.1 thymidine kinase, cytosolic-like [Varroa jacobsoni]XP_022697770.1 thymidine kinase, cytosolic-like [Varroa jacobsoni]XP_022697771.1 thymidine kinase, cytosolic-like [Varroa jacobsoni]XP_022697772.1 thymidine kinase, cytosolic-like [Varroa jacobsoni]XP_022697773.1 thymidine kinase, cytosolic-